MVVDEADLQTGLEPLCQLVQLLKPILPSAAKQLSINQSINQATVSGTEQGRQQTMTGESRFGQCESLL